MTQHSIATREELLSRIQAMCKRADQISVEHFKSNGFSWSPPTHTCEIGQKWAKIWANEGQDSRISPRQRIYAFVAMTDFSNKALGNVKRGDIHKAATYLAPAKTARGNVAEDDFRNCLTEYGIVYLR
jgi:hypothetical protein